MRGFKYILSTLALMASASVWGQYNPTNPAEPGAPVTQYTLTLQTDPSGGGSFNLNPMTSQTGGEAIWIRAYPASNFTFVSWEENGEIISSTESFTYTMPAKNANLIAHFRYTPSSPAEPAEPDIPAKPVYSNIYLTASPTGGGSFNITSGSSYQVGNSVNLTANPASNFTFVNWTQDGEVISTSRTFNYVMLEGIDANQLVANFTYTPGSPGEPAEPEARKKYHRVFLMANPSGGGYFNFESGNQFEEGSTQSFRAYNNQWYTFVNWTIDGEIVSTNSTYSMTIPTDDITLTANYTYNYDPGSPGEPGQSTDKHLSIYGMTANGALGQNVIYPVFLENTEDVYAVTVVVRFPEGFKVNTDNAIQAERAAGHTLSVTALDNNAYRFDLTGNDLLTGQNGKIFDVPVTISSEATANQSYLVVLSNAARINNDGSKEVIATRNGYIFVEEMKEDGLYSQFSYEKLQNRVKFTNLSSDKALSYSWDFGDGSTSTEENPMHIYAKSGYYDVQLTAKGKTGTDVALMTVLINDENTWTVEGTFFLDSKEQGVRSFTATDQLLGFMTASPISGNLKIIVKDGQTFNCEQTDENLNHLTSIHNALAEGSYTLTIAKSGEGDTPILNFGKKSSDIDHSVINLFIALGQNMICDNVNLQLWGIGFNPSKLEQLKSQTVLSGKPTTEVDLSLISTDLIFSWTATTETETARDYQKEGKGNIPSMTAISGSVEDCHLIYNIVATYQEMIFFETTHTITIRPALEGTFTELLPADESELETTTVTLSWNKINNAIYDVYLWNATNKRPTTPVAEGINELSYTSQNFCQNNRSYKWQVVARNALQEIVSDTMHFKVKILPDLHIYDLNATTDLQAGHKATIEWIVRNDGNGSTDDQSWKDRLWLVPDVYSGTSQNSCRLLAELPNVSSLDSGKEYTGRAEVEIDENIYGSYYLLVASDMSSVNLIDWTSVGGTIVNPYSPVHGGNADEGTYAHLFATTVENGNLLKEHGETSTRSDNFFYKKVDIAAPSVDEADWEALKTIYEEMGGGEGWSKPWNFDSENRSVLSLPGVQLRKGLVVGLDLSNNNLSGEFPTSLLKLPNLETLNLSNNHLKGDIGQTMKEFQEKDPSQEVKIKHVNISDNKLTGNIGEFAQYCPVLESLNASGNKLDEVTPMISPKVTDLNIGKQEIEKTISVHLRDLSAETIMTQLPNILLYNHAKQNFATSINLLCTTKDESWGLMLSCLDGSLTMPYVTENNAFREKSGDILNVAVVDSKRQKEGSSLNMILEFEQGDSNFDGNVDVVDLQATINFAFEDYREKAFNFTAANLWTDDIINVQDVVKMVDLLMTSNSNTPNNVSPARLKKAGISSEEASIYIEGSKLWLYTERPVAALDITIKGASVAPVAAVLEEMGFTCRTNDKNGMGHVIAYSLTGVTIPTTTTLLGDLNKNSAMVVQAILSDIYADNISVALKGTTTGLIDVFYHDSHSNMPVYNLQGQKVSTIKNGLYIQDGHKIVNGKPIK